MDTTFECEHGKFVCMHDCEICWEKDRKEQDEIWWNNLKENAESYRHYWQVTHPIFAKLCGDPIEIDQFR